METIQGKSKTDKIEILVKSVGGSFESCFSCEAHNYLSTIGEKKDFVPEDIYEIRVPSNNSTLCVSLCKKHLSELAKISTSFENNFKMEDFDKSDWFAFAGAESPEGKEPKIGFLKLSGYSDDYKVAIIADAVGIDISLIPPDQIDSEDVLHASFEFSSFEKSLEKLSSISDDMFENFFELEDFLGQE